MNFTKFRDAVHSNFQRMSKQPVFQVDIDTDAIWDIYLQSFPEGTNPIYRERTEHDCSCCRNFIKNLGTLVVITKGNTLETVWDITLQDQYQVVANALAAAVRNAPIKGIYRTNESCYGTKSNPEILEDRSVKTWQHFYSAVPVSLQVSRGRSVGDITGQFTADYGVFRRSLEEITIESLDTVSELIAQNSLYRGQEHSATVEALRKHKKAYDKIPAEQRSNYMWNLVAQEGSKLRFKNTVIGTLLTDLSEGVDLETAVKSFETKVAPFNYKRPTALVTQSMINKAKDKVTELGLEASLYRRHAKESDISVNNVLFVDRSTKLKDSIFDDLTPSKTAVKPNLDKVQDVTYRDFINNILPTAQEIELFVDNKYANNFVSLVAPQYPDAPNLFKWDNGFSWSYNGEVTDSMKERVKSAGGSVTGVLRFSIQWNEEGQESYNDLDAYCDEPAGRIYFGTRSVSTGGNLDVDIRAPGKNIAVENITWPSLSRMKDGKYSFYVRNYSGMNHKGVRAQIEFNGQIFEYDYPQRVKDRVDIAEVTLKNGVFSIEHKLNSSQSSREVWGVHTQQWAKVKTIMKSPNYWGTCNKSGNEHLFFMLDNCKNPDSVRGFYNEFLKSELTEHRKVFEMLSGRMKAEYSDDQLSGLGFSSTKQDSVLCKVSGTFNRVIRIIF